jgi:hypothetical protein
MAPTKARAAKKPMSKEHKDKLAAARREGRTVGAFLDALENSRPRRGRRVDASPQRLAQLETEIAAASGVRKLELVQQKLELERLSRSNGTETDLDELRKQFAKVAKQYGERKGISYAAWRQVGVPAEVLREAGISR